MTSLALYVTLFSKPLKSAVLIFGLLFVSSISFFFFFFCRGRVYFGIKFEELLLTLNILKRKTICTNKIVRH